MHMPEDSEVRLNPNLFKVSLFELRPAWFSVIYNASVKKPTLEKFNYEF